MEAPLPVANGSVAAVAQRVLPSTVQSSRSSSADAGATGSGFALDTQGHFMTNNHVVADAAENDGPIKVVDQDGNSTTRRSSAAAPPVTSRCFSSESPGLPPASLGASHGPQRR